MSYIPKTEGLVAAPFTPMHANGSLNLATIPEYAHFLVQNGIKGAFIGGSTGEGVSLSFPEKLELLQAWGQVDEPSLAKIMLVGGTSLEESKLLAKEASRAGFQAVAVLAPFYFKPANVELLAQFCIQIGEAAPDLGLYFYHIPALTGANLSMIDFLACIDGRLPNFYGIKYTHNDLMDFRQCVLFEKQKYDILWGWDEIYLAAMAMGARGAVGSTFNYAAPLYYDLMAAFNAGDLEKARQLQDKSIAIVRILGKYGGIATGKAFMRAVGIDCGGFRLPIANMSAVQYPRFLEDLHAIDFYAYASQMPVSTVVNAD
ncbi:dihydrodipicolinate synthetase [Spirosoma sp. HMF4905]|uniref:Dihydrodipicolinate synthetase n=1 Tax=Spirosoma arboris TaxID=2682092 RepID=A0A7K1SK56_9BACT|nr:dihydrodipicolinate synthase family protein [Spirosoma arboris]MVM33976.1 dihydrodipicolinate synthetase [Spirosoma arboris]